MLKLNTVCWVLSIILLCGCTGKIITTNLDNSTINTDNKEFEGVIHYPRALFYEVSRTTIRQDAKGNIIGWEVEEDGSEKCIPVESRKLVVRPDYSNPRLISYEHGILEDYKFNVTLNDNGTLKTTGSESHPDRGQTLSNLTSAAINGAKIATGALFVAPAFPPCNAGSVVIAIIRHTVE